MVPNGIQDTENESNELSGLTETTLKEALENCKQWKEAIRYSNHVVLW